VPYTQAILPLPSDATPIESPSEVPEGASGPG
jgi:hypothetical protein